MTKSTADISAAPLRFVIPGREPQRSGGGDPRMTEWKCLPLTSAVYHRCWCLISALWVRDKRQHSISFTNPPWLMRSSATPAAKVVGAWGDQAWRPADA